VDTQTRAWTEPERLAALRRYDILDTPREEAFDDLVALACELCNTPISVVTLIDDQRQWFKAEHGLGISETPRDASICAHAMLEPGIFVIPDTTRDARFSANPFVTGAPNLRFYAGATLETEDGLPLGMLCVLDYQPRPDLTPSQRRVLQALARQVMTLIELRRALNGQRKSEAQLLKLNQTLEEKIRERTAALRLNEEALRQAQKMEAIGQLTGGIAHDFNNLLQAIGGSIAVSQKLLGMGRTAEIERFLLSASGSIKRAAALTHRLLAFSRRQPLNPRPMSPNQLLTATVDMFRRAIGESIQLELQLAAGLWLTRCDPNQLENAVLNLVINARDAMPDGGALTISTRNAVLDGDYAAAHPEIRPGDYACLAISDTGVGMSTDVLARAFDPFFTTKPIGQGTGLGLSMIYGFARQSEGQVRIQSELGAGTTVELYLPRFHGALDSVMRTDSVSAAAPTVGSTILVIEDEADVRTLIVEYLDELGYRALSAIDGTSALAILESHEPIDLLLTDVGLPGLNGRQIADAARESRPTLKVLFMTGYAENAAVDESFLADGMQILAKPFAMEVLSNKLAHMLG
jgi:signal transduction histidine kinase